MSKTICIIPMRQGASIIYKAMLFDNILLAEPCLVDGSYQMMVSSKPSVLIGQLPDGSNEHFWLSSYVEGKKLALAKYGILVEDDTPLDGYHPNKGTGENDSVKCVVLSELVQDPLWSDEVIDDSSVQPISNQHTSNSLNPPGAQTHSSFKSVINVQALIEQRFTDRTQTKVKKGHRSSTENAPQINSTLSMQETANKPWCRNNLATTEDHDASKSWIGNGPWESIQPEMTGTQVCGVEQMVEHRTISRCDKEGSWGGPCDVSSGMVSSPKRCPESMLGNVGKQQIVGDGSGSSQVIGKIVNTLRGASAGQGVHFNTMANPPSYGKYEEEQNIPQCHFTDGHVWTEQVRRPWCNGIVNVAKQRNIPCHIKVTNIPKQANATDVLAFFRAIGIDSLEVSCDASNDNKWYVTGCFDDIHRRAREIQDLREKPLFFLNKRLSVEINSS